MDKIVSLRMWNQHEEIKEHLNDYCENGWKVKTIDIVNEGDRRGIWVIVCLEK